MNWDRVFHSIAAVLVGVATALFLSLLFAGCDKIVVVLPPNYDAAVIVNEDMSTDEAFNAPVHPNGQLPLGYYQLGCQWDAPCDPAPQTSPLNDPIP